MDLLGEEIVTLLRVDSGIVREEMGKLEQQGPETKGKGNVFLDPGAGHCRGIQAKSEGQEEPGGKARISARKGRRGYQSHRPTIKTGPRA